MKPLNSVHGHENLNLVISVNLSIFPLSSSNLTVGFFPSLKVECVIANQKGYEFFVKGKASWANRPARHGHTILKRCKDASRPSRGLLVALEISRPFTRPKEHMRCIKVLFNEDGHDKDK